MAIALLSAAVLDAIYLTFALRRQVDPVTAVVSDSVYHALGAPLLVLAVLLMVLAGLMITVGMKELGIFSERAVRVLFGLWFAGLLLVVVFPTNRTRLDITLHGDIHRVGGAVFLTCLPLACWTLAWSLRADPRWTAHTGRIRRLSAITWLAALAFGASQVNRTLPQGLLERFALGAEVALLAVLALAITAVERQTR
jgi:hypothetical protein